MKHYVYVYLDPRKPGCYQYGKFTFEHEPFYIGLGQNERIHWHIADTLSVVKSGKRRSFKHNKILKILDSGQEPVRLKMYDGISAYTASRLERLFIKAIGRYDQNKGPLVNLTDGGDGTLNHVFTDEQRLAQCGEGNSFYGKLHTEETKDKIKETIGDRIGASNGNYGKQWSKEQKTAASIRQAENHAHLTGDANPAKREDVRKTLSEGKMGLKNPNASRWLVTSPEGLEYTYDGGIHDRLKDHGMTYMRMCHHKEDDVFYSKNGWSMRKVA